MPELYVFGNNVSLSVNCDASTRKLIPNILLYFASVVGEPFQVRNVVLLGGHAAKQKIRLGLMSIV